MVFPAPVLLEVSSHQLEVAETLIGVGRFLVIFVGLGTQAGILTPALEAAILLEVIGTTFLAPVLLRIVIPEEPDQPDAQALELPA